MKNKSNVLGITLIELMIVIAIVGILAAIGYPSYQAYVIKTNRADATANLLEASQFMERYFSEVGNYQGAVLPITQSPNDGSTAKYTITFEGGATTATVAMATAYTLVASPTTAQNDSQCGALRINSVGVKCITNATTCSTSGTASVRSAVADCW